MRKTILITLVLCIIIGFSFNIISAESVDNIFIYENKEIIINGEIDYHTMKKIADFIAGEAAHNDEISTRALDCSLGHSIVSGVTAIEVEHNVYEGSFKCVETIYDVEYCSRPNCDYILKTIISQTRTSACHG